MVVLLATGTASVALVLAQAGPASAHVTVSSPDAAAGGFGKLVFRVPSESDTASTTAVQVTLPTDTPFAFVSTKPLAGWTVSTTERRLDKPLTTEGFTITKAVATVTWTAAAGHGLKPGEFEEFEISAGPFPAKPGTLMMPAVQSYSDGTKVAWDQPSTPGGAEPEHPAPTLKLAAKTSDPGGASTTSKLAATTAATADDGLARWLGGLGLALGAAGLVVAMLTRRRRPV
jgi:uncharacterized protein YcnI